MQLRDRADANGTDRRGDVPDTPTMRRLKRALAAQRRIDSTVATAVVDAVEAGDKQIEIAHVMGRSREYVRLLVEAHREPREG